MFRQRQTSRSTHFVGSTEIGTVRCPFRQNHDQHINGHNAEYPPKTGRVERLSAPVKCTENDTYRFYRKTKRHDIHQIGKHGVTHRLVKSFRVTYCNILYCIHILFYLYAIICISSFLRIVLMDENPTSCNRSSNSAGV